MKHDECSCGITIEILDELRYLVKEIRENKTQEEILDITTRMWQLLAKIRG